MGRYDATYENQGRDYPFGFVRWTEQRNFEAILELIRSGKLDVKSMIDAEVPLDDAPALYAKIGENKAALGQILKYPDAPNLARTVTPSSSSNASTPAAGRVVVGAIGAGNYAKLMLLPAFKNTAATLHTVASAGGVSAQHAASKFGFRHATTDTDALIQNAEINTVVITTRHNSHARWTIAALQAGKHVFVEKPMALTVNELNDVVAAAEAASDRQLLVGFNRRFAPHAVKMRSLLAGRSEPLTMVMTVNAGFIPPDHWLHDPNVGGGRIVGEGCHWIDLLAFLADGNVTAVQAMQVDEWTGQGGPDDKMTITLAFADGSIGTIHYLANGHKSFPKERLEVFSDGRILQLDNFRVLRGYGFGGFKKLKTSRMDKGHQAEVDAFARAVSSGAPPLIPLASLVNTTRASFAALASIESGQLIKLDQ